MTSPAAAPRVVAAVSREVQRRIRAILPGCELHFVQTEEQLLRALNEARCDMLIVGSHFDESTAVAALERVLARGASFPVVCVRVMPFAARLGQPTVEALRMASSELGAQHFIDLLQYPDDENGNARVRALLQRLLPDQA
jgi:DNA-binding LacI/PurR family transcriptional regulator